MPRCEAITQAGSRCSRNTLSKFCKQHECIHGLNDLKDQLKSKEDSIKYLLERLKHADKNELDDVIKKISEKNGEIFSLLQENVEKISMKLDSIEDTVVNESEKTRTTINDNSMWLANGFCGGISEILNRMNRIEDKLESRESAKAITFIHTDKAITVRANRERNVWRKRLN